jgi:hypothetical protein
VANANPPLFLRFMVSCWVFAAKAVDGAVASSVRLEASSELRGTLSVACIVGKVWLRFVSLRLLLLLKEPRLVFFEACKAVGGCDAPPTIAAVPFRWWWDNFGGGDRGHIPNILCSCIWSFGGRCWRRVSV